MKHKNNPVPKKLIEKYLKNECSADELNALFEFFKDPENRHQLEGIADEVWRKIQVDFELRDDHSEKIKAGILTHIQKDRPKKSKVVEFLLYRNLGRVAAAVVLAFVVGLSIYLAANKPQDIEKVIAHKQFKTPHGKKAHIQLPDGTIVHLNSGSEISYPEIFEQNKRIVELSGEAFFEVKRDTQRPFVIHSQGITTTVLGTTFLIRAFEGERVRVAVATGKVQVADSLNQNTILTPNKQATYTEDGGFVVNETNTAELIRWKDDYLVLDGTMKDVALKLERWYGIDVQFADGRALQCQIKATYKGENLPNVLQSISKILDVHFERHGNTVRFIGSGCN